ncbi:MAG TPA: hypothetical protein VIY53_02345 [Acidobacteriaceae bacterium]
MRLSIPGVIGLLCASAAWTLPAQTAPASPAPSALPESAQDLAHDVLYNELHDRERDSHWQYRSECTSASDNYVREQVETDSGPIYRVIERGGAPPDADARVREDERIDEYIHDPAQIARVARTHQEDEDRLAAAMQLLPQAALFAYDGSAQNGIVRLAFHPNPAFVPSGMEAHIVHALSGTLTVDLRQKRLIEMRGVVTERVDFGYGLLAQVAKGGWYVIHRRPVSGEHWKTDLVDVHLEGHLLLLRTLGKIQRETRSDFHPVAPGTTLAEAQQLLNRAGAQAVQARLASPAVDPQGPGAKN